MVLQIVAETFKLYYTCIVQNYSKSNGFSSKNKTKYCINPCLLLSRKRI